MNSLNSLWEKHWAAILIVLAIADAFLWGLALGR